MAVVGDRVTVNSDGQQIVAEVTQVSLVATIVALLLQHVEFNCDDWNDTEIDGIQTSILDRVLGRNDVPTTRSIPELLDGPLAEEGYPVSSNTCHWIDPRTGEATAFPLQHAIDFAYYVEGGRLLAPVDVGPSFCQPPRQPAQQPQCSRARASEEAHELFDPFSDDDQSPQDQSERAEVVTPVPSGRQPSTKRVRDVPASGNGEEWIVDRQQRRRTGPRSALDKDALIAERLGDDPDLWNVSWPSGKAEAAEAVGLTAQLVLRGIE